MGMELFTYQWLWGIQELTNIMMSYDEALKVVFLFRTGFLKIKGRSCASYDCLPNRQCEEMRRFEAG